MFLHAMLLSGGTLWCAQMVRRVGEDVGTLRDPSTARVEKIAIGLLWGATALIALWTVSSLTGIVRGLFI